MGEKQLCKTCKGSKYVEVLESQHDDKKTTVLCFACNGKGSTYVWSDEDESDYRSSMDGW